MRTKSYSDSTPAVTYGYEKDQNGNAVTNAVGRMTFVSTSVSTTSYTQLDALGRILQSKQATQAGGSQSYTLSYEYNLAGQMTTETYPSLKKVVTSYDSAGRINQVKDQALNKVYASGFSYASHGGVTAVTLGNNLIEGTTFNNRLQPVQIKLGTAASPSSVLQLDYTYGVRVSGVLDVTKNNGNVERQTISFTGLNAQQSYTYDALNRLKTMSEPGGWSQTCSYDRFGNRWVSAGTIPSPQQTPQTQTSFDAATNRVNPAVMTGFAYDSVGNLTSDPSTPGNGIAYDAENRQTSYTKSGVGTTSYSYDGEGRRVKKVTGSPAVTTVYVYDVTGRLVAEYNDSQQQPTGGTKYLTSDHLGSTRVVTAQNQGVAARYDYLPFGEEIGAGVGSRTVQMGYGASDTTRQKFTSKERDTESGLDYFLARYYSGAQGRFISADPLITSGKPKDPQSWNRYTYTLNNPMVLIDPDGLEWRTNDKTGVLKWFGKDADRSGTTEYTQEYYSIEGQWVHLNKNGYTNNPNDSTFDRQGWDYVDASQVPGIYNHDNLPQITAAPGDDSGPLSLFFEWLTGSGPVERQFGPDTYMTQNMMTSPDIVNHRQAFIDQGGGTYGPTGTRFGVSAEDGPFTAGTNRSRQFVGSYTITITEQSNGDALFVLRNTTSLPSALYHIPGIQPVERSTMHPLSNKSQTFWWSERGVIKR